MFCWRYAFAAEETVILVQQGLNRVTRAVGLNRRIDDIGRATLIGHDAAPHAIGPTLGFAQIGIDTTHEVRTQNRIAQTQHQIVVSARNRQDLTSHDDRLRRLRTVDQHDTGRGLRQRCREVLDAFGHRRCTPVTKGRVQLLCHL